MITLHVEPGITYSWDMFRQLKPPYSIALDGFVKSETRREFNGQFANFDHHDDVDRLTTRSTCEQVYMEINMGLFDIFRKDGLPEAHLWVNDCDEDTCLAVWLLQNHELVVQNANPAINRLVACEDRLDATGGGYPLGDTGMSRKLAWIFELYNRARFSGALKNMEVAAMQGIIEATCQRISAYTMGNWEELPLAGNYERLGGGSDWVLVKESGPFARRAMFAEGIKAFVSILGRKDDNYVYSIGRRSPWVLFNLPRIMNYLNAEEYNRLAALAPGKISLTTFQGWGPVVSGAMIGGSSRKWGSFLKPEELIPMIELNKGMES